MLYLLIVFILNILTTKYQVFGDNVDKYPKDTFDEKYYNSGYKRVYKASMTENFVCNPECKAKIIKLDLVYKNISYPHLCDYDRQYSANLIYGITTKTSPYPIATVLSHSFINETRKNGNLNLLSIGYVDDNSCDTIKGSTFLSSIDLPNLDPDVCCTIEGLTKQTGVGEIIFSTIDRQTLYNLWISNTGDQLKAIFKNNTLAHCIGCTLFNYKPGLLENKALIEYYPIPEPETTRNTRYYSDYTVDDCDHRLPVKIGSIREIMSDRINDSCDSIELPYLLGYEKIVINLEIAILNQNNSQFVTKSQVKLLYFKHQRNNGSYTATTIGVVVDGPRRLIGSTYLELLDLPNQDPTACYAPPGIKHLSGSAEKIFSRIDVQNLLSVFDLKTIIKKIRSNRIADCLGCITIAYKPGLLSSELIKSGGNSLKDDSLDDDWISNNKFNDTTIAY